MRTIDWLLTVFIICVVVALSIEGFKRDRHNINRSPCQTVTLAVPGPVAVIQVDGSTILVNEKEFTLPAGDTRFTVRAMDGKAVKMVNCTAYGVKE